MKNTNDVIGRRTAMARSGSVFSAADTLSYLYNDRSEVTGANSNAAGSLYHYAYSFDNIGNRLTANLAGTPWTYTASNLNQYTAFTKNQIAETPSYDDDGNMLTRDGWIQTWNAENRLIKAEKGTTKLEFAYDYMGRRIFKKVFNGNTLTSHTRFVYDGYKLMEELDALNSNAVLRRYAWSLVGLDTPVSVYDAAANATYYYHTDANKNITELTSASGSVVAHYEYSPFGKVIVSTGSYAGTNPFRFSSEYHDDETGLVYYNYRYYSPELGRWLSRDPIGEQGGVNLYGFCYCTISYDYVGLMMTISKGNDIPHHNYKGHIMGLGYGFDWSLSWSLSTEGSPSDFLQDANSKEANLTFSLNGEVGFTIGYSKFFSILNHDFYFLSGVRFFGGISASTSFKVNFRKCENKAFSADLGGFIYVGAEGGIMARYSKKNKNDWKDIQGIGIRVKAIVGTTVSLTCIEKSCTATSKIELLKIQPAAFVNT